MADPRLPVAVLLAAAAIALGIGMQRTPAAAELGRPGVGDGRGGVRLNELARFEAPT